MMLPLHLTPLALDWLEGPGGGGDVGVVRGKGKGLFRAAELGGDLGADMQAMMVDENRDDKTVISCLHLKSVSLID